MDEDEPKFGQVWQWDADDPALYFCIAPSPQVGYVNFMPIVDHWHVVSLRMEDNWTGKRDARWSLVSKGELV